MFKSLPIAKSTVRHDALPAEATGFAGHTVTLGWEERLRTRARRRSGDGFEFATALPRGTILYEDDCFIFDSARILVRVVELAEPMLVVRPGNQREWGLFAYH